MKYDEKRKGQSELIELCFRSYTCIIIFFFSFVLKMLLKFLMWFECEKRVHFIYLFLLFQRGQCFNIFNCENCLQMTSSLDDWSWKITFLALWTSLRLIVSDKTMRQFKELIVRKYSWKYCFPFPLINFFHLNLMEC